VDVYVVMCVSLTVSATVCSVRVCSEKIGKMGRTLETAGVLVVYRRCGEERSARKVFEEALLDKL
jgi:hypothetical protein